MVRRAVPSRARYGTDIETWTGPLGPFYRIPTEKELAQAAADAAAARVMVERRFGADSDIAQMLGLVESPALEVAGA